MKNPASFRKLQPTISGTGLLALDVIFNQESDEPPQVQAGGTCGNVLTILSYLGWHAAPISRLARGKPAERLKQDLERWNVDTSFVATTDDGSTPVIFHRIGRRANGKAFHSFSWRCPECGAHFPGYKPVLAGSAQAIADDLPPCQAYFFDRVSRGALNLATALSEQGAVIVFEPSGVSDPNLFREAWRVSHIVKYSHERLREIADLDLDARERQGVLLEIETLGEEGLRYRSRLPKVQTNTWTKQPAFRIDDLRDSAGAGDWCTAGLLSKLARSGQKGLRRISKQSLSDAFRYGQALSSWNCRFEGARGGMYKVSADAFKEQTKAILESGEMEAITYEKNGTKADRLLAHLCSACKHAESAFPLRTRKTSVG